MTHEDEFDIVEDGSPWKWYESYTMTKGDQQLANHLAQQVTRKVDPSYDGRTSFFAFGGAIDDWCDITELEPEKRGPDSCFEEQTRRRCICLQRLLNRIAEGPYRWCELFEKILATAFHQRSSNNVSVSVHSVHET